MAITSDVSQGGSEREEGRGLRKEIKKRTSDSEYSAGDARADTEGKTWRKTAAWKIKCRLGRCLNVERYQKDSN